MPAYENLIYEKQRNGALLTLNRPEAMNALSNGPAQRDRRRLGGGQE